MSKAAYPPVLLRDSTFHLDVLKLALRLVNSVVSLYDLLCLAAKSMNSFSSFAALSSAGVAAELPCVKTYGAAKATALSRARAKIYLICN